jgi:hypothetical protein
MVGFPLSTQPTRELRLLAQVINDADYTVFIQCDTEDADVMSLELSRKLLVGTAHPTNSV